MLQLTSTFGPIIRICFKMLSDMITFFVIFFLQITAFACVGVLIFGEIPEYDDLYTAIVMIFQTAMGAWDLTVYDVLSDDRKYIGVLFHILLICVNLLLLLNLMIALMSDTYANLAVLKRGLYYKCIV